MTMCITVDRAHLDRVLTVLQQQETPYLMEQVTKLCPDLTDDQVFLAIDYLTRSGQVCLTMDSNRMYWVRAARSSEIRERCPLPAAHGHVNTN
ncbi:MAG: hypothetical protein JNN16_02880 [Nitrospira sp.]|nr:hypothetical protein [Nitrospira sp.]